MTRWCIVGALALAGCAGQKADEPPLPDASRRLLGSWTLDRVGGERAPDCDRAPTVTIAEGGRVSGGTGANNWFGTLETSVTSVGGFVVSGVGVTRKAGSPEAMRLEIRFIEAITAARMYDRAFPSGRLRIFDEQGRELAVFTPSR